VTEVTPLFAWGVSLVPYLVLGNIALVAIIFIIARTGRSRAFSLLARGAVIVSVIWWIYFYSVTDVKTRATVPMTWEIDPPHNAHPELKEKHVRLYFQTNPNKSIGVYSDQVANYLQSLPTKEVNVAFDVIKDFGHLRALHEVQIGELKSWDGPSNYSYFRSAGGGPDPL
jgi:hypothetical protein